jgi:alkaline phosphatase D
MVCYSEMRQVLLWVQTTRAARVRFLYRERGSSETMRSTTEVTTIAANAFVAKVIIDSLDPGKRYSYELQIDGRRVERPYPLEFQTQRLWQYREDPPSFTLALGSCAYINEPPYERPGEPYGGGYGIFTSIAARHPDVMLWLGDNIYLREIDWGTREGIIHRYTHGRSLPEMQPLLGATHNYAIWDDHDYGSKDANRSFRGKDISRAVFDLFWGNPTDGAAPPPGINTSFEWGDAEFFLLDDRTWRSPNRAKTGTRQILGEEQIRWLIDRLTTSSATFKFVAIGGQVLNPAALYENYATYPAERERLLELIAEEGIPGVIFLSGDRHHSELTVMPRAGSYPLYDLTVSPLTSHAYDDPTEPNTLRVPGTYVGERNFATIEFSGATGKRQLTIRTFAADGRELWTRTITAAEIGPPP